MVSAYAAKHGACAHRVYTPKFSWCIPDLVYWIHLLCLAENSLYLCCSWSFHPKWWKWAIQKEHDSADFFTNISLELALEHVDCSKDLKPPDLGLRISMWSLYSHPPPPLKKMSIHPFAPKCPTLTYPSLPNSPRNVPNQPIPHSKQPKSTPPLQEKLHVTHSYFPTNCPIIFLWSD